MKKLALLLIAFLSSTGLNAHNVTWWENQDGFPFIPGAPITPPPMSIEIYRSDLFSPLPPYEVIKIIPDYGFEEIGAPLPIPFFEPCTVYVSIDPPESPLLGVALEPNGSPFFRSPLGRLNALTSSQGIRSLDPALEYDVIVYLRDLPTNSTPVQTFISGEWHASGQPENAGCTATNPNPFIVPVVISLAGPWDITPDRSSGNVNIDTHKDVALQVADNVNGPYITVGQGHLFSFFADAIAQFFRGIKQTAGGVLGTVTDPSGQPQTNITVGLPQGGPHATADAKGNYTLNALATGLNLLELVKTFLVTDEISGEKGTNLAYIDIDIPILKAYGTLNFKVEMQSFTIPLCNCTPWCSIGFASLDGKTTPIYFSGGANPPKKGPASCGAVEVTVTRPDGSTFPLKAGRGKHQNSGANPMPGTWKVTTKVCGQEKTCSISYP